MTREREHRDLDFEIEFFERLLAKKDNFVEVMVPLAEAYTKKGLYSKGLELDIKLSDIKPNDPIVLYNLSCSYSLMGMIDESLSALERAITCGYRDFRFMDNDSDLNNLKKNSRYWELKKRYSNKKYKTK